MVDNDYNKTAKFFYCISIYLLHIFHLNEGNKKKLCPLLNTKHQTKYDRLKIDSNNKHLLRKLFFSTSGCNDKISI